MSRYIIVLLAIMALSGYASAYDVSEINITIGGDGFVQVIQTIIFEGEGEYVNIALPKKAQNIVLGDNFGPIQFNITQTDEEEQIRIFFRQYLEIDAKDEITLRYDTNYITRKEEDRWYLSFETPSTPRKTIIRLKYPKNTQILTLNPEDLYRSYVEDGIWIYPQNQEINFSSTYIVDKTEIIQRSTTTLENPQITPPTPSDENTLGLIALIIFSLAVIIYVIYKFRAHGHSSSEHKKQFIVRIADDVLNEQEGHDQVRYTNDIEVESLAKPSIKDSVIKILNEKEMMIVKLLEESKEEEITQAYVHKTTGIPKSSLSDILKQMEKRNIIDRTGEGRIKWIKLKSWVFE